MSLISVLFLPTNPANTKLADALRSDALTFAPTKFDTPDTDALFLFNTMSAPIFLN